MFLWDAYCYLLGLFLKIALGILGILFIGFFLFGFLFIPIFIYKQLELKYAPIWAKILCLSLFMPILYGLWCAVWVFGDYGFDIPFARTFAR